MANYLFENVWRSEHGGERVTKRTDRPFVGGSWQGDLPHTG